MLWMCLVFNSSDAKQGDLLEKKKQLTQDIAQLRQLYDSLVAKFPHLHFEYK